MNDEKKRKSRGRPRKEDNISNLTQEKKTRGRPRKKNADENKEDKSSSDTIITEKKKKGVRGRNKKPIIITAPPLDINDDQLSSDEEQMILEIPIQDLDLDNLDDEETMDSLFKEHMPSEVPTPEFDENGNAHSMNIKDLQNPDIEIPEEPIPSEMPLKYELFFPSDTDSEDEKDGNSEPEVNDEVKIKRENQLIGSLITGRYGESAENLFTKVSIYNLNQPTMNDGTYLCWWCCHKFRGVIIPLPYRYVEPVEKSRNYYKVLENGKKRWIGRHYIESEKPFFKVRGCFCSYNCARSYNLKLTYDGEKSYRDSLINFFYRKMSGDNVLKNIPAAPPRETLIAFGGHLNIAQFRINTDTKFDIINGPKISQLQVTIEESKHEKHTSVPLDLMKNMKPLRNRKINTRSSTNSKSREKKNSLLEFNNNNNKKLNI